MIYVLAVVVSAYWDPPESSTNPHFGIWTVGSPAEPLAYLVVTFRTHEDIDGVYAGLRPLLHGESEETSKLSREHAVAVPTPGLVAIAGGKYTTYRVMAADAVDAAAEFVPSRVAPSITEKVPLLGADG